MKKKIVKTLYAIFLVLIAPVLLFNIIIIIKSIVSPNTIPGVFGYKPMIVLTGSMEPEIKTGDLVIVKETNETDLEIGTIISYRDNFNTVVTHRIVAKEAIDNEIIYKTQGDANDVEDDFNVTNKLIEGVYVKRIPKLGSILEYIQTLEGIIIITLVFIIFFALIWNITGKTKIDKQLEKEFEEFKKQQKEKYNKDL